MTVEFKMPGEFRLLPGADFAPSPVTAVMDINCSG